MPASLHLGPFQLVAPLARGGMAEVWRAVHAETGLPVAVKVMSSDELKEERNRALFRDEVRAMARLQHPGVVLVLDQGAIDGLTARRSRGSLREGSPYLVMEHASGGTLADVRGPVSWERLQAVLLALLDALGHAHARGVIHRDLKAGNVLLCTADDARPGLKLTDFGIAFAAGADGAAPMHAGTLQYMAPEQLLGEWREYGPWTDLYALGCLAWRLCTGGTPFGDRQGDALALAHLEAPLPRLRPLAPVPEGFEGWLRALLARRPQDRCRRAADAAWALLQLGPAPAGGAEDGALVDVPPVTGHPLQRTADPDSQPTVVLTSPPQRMLGRGEEGPSLPPPPMPRTWRRPVPPRAPLRLLGAGPALVPLREIPLAGREEERDALWAALRQVHEERRPAAVVVRGAAGTGRTRLVRWVGERAHELGAVTVLEAGLGVGEDPAEALRQMVRRHHLIQRLDREGVEERLRRLDGADRARLDALVDLLVAPGAQAGPEERRAVLGGWVATVARERPVLLHLDDVHESPEAVALAETVLESGAPVLVVATARDDRLAERPELRQRVEALGRDLVLAPLPPHEQALLLRNLLPLEEALAARVEERTAGNPLFAVQLVGDWVARGLLELGPTGFALRADATGALPDDLHAVWEARVDRLLHGLDPVARAHLERAAALGHEVVDDEWHQACDDPTGLPYRLTRDGLALRAVLVDRLLGGRLAEETPTGWTFAHAMLRETLERGARREGRWPGHHLACAAMLQTREEADPGRVGVHLLEGGAHAAAVDVLLEAIPRRLITHGARAALARVAACEAAMVRAPVPPDDPRHARLWSLRATAHRDQGQPADALRWAEQAVALAVREGDPVEHARALFEVGRARQVQGDLHAAEQAFTEATPLARAHDPALLAKVLNERAFLAQQQGRLEEGRLLAEQAEAAHRKAGNERGLAYSWLCQGTIAVAAGDLPRARSLFGRCLDGFARSRDRLGLAFAHNNLGDIARKEVRLDEAVPHYEQTVALFRVLGMRTGVPRLNLALVQLARRRFEEARVALEPLLDRERIVGALASIFLLPCDADRRDWAAWDRHLAAGWPPLAAAGFVDRDLAWACALAAEVAAAAGEGVRSADLAALARQQEEALER